MNFKSRLQSFALKRGLVINKAVPHSDMETFIKRFNENYFPVDLIRVGGEGDGGYLVPNCFESIKYCFSPGVDYTASFEGQLSREYGIKSFMADASVSDSPVDDKNFSFLKKYLGSKKRDDYISLSDWVSECIGNEEAEMILQMDIEGGEYDVIATESASSLARFSLLVIEFHGLQNLFDRYFLQATSAVFEKIYDNFVVCHAHPNNCSGIAVCDGIEVPRVLEVSFIRKDLLDRFIIDAPVTLPHPLDGKNTSSMPEITMPEAWWDGAQR